MPAPLESFTAGVETAVDVAGIERQLTELWQQAAATETDSKPGSVTRACLLNFVAYTETEPARDHAAAAISDLTSEHPCRAIVLLAEPDTTRNELSASITAHCHLAGGGRQVCCEQISITAAGTGLSQLGGAVLPLLESDLPTVLWWQGNFLKRPDLFHRLAGVADRLLFDSAANQIPLPALARAIAEHPRCRFGDLSWTRLAFWRKLTADIFDATECRDELTALQSVELIHGQAAGGEQRARLFGGWLAAQLGGLAGKIRFSASDDDAGLSAVILKSPGGRFEIRKLPGEQTACATAFLPTVCELPRKRALWSTDDVSLLSQELDQPARHRVYERALVAAAALL